jgi:hypothetical protein
MFSQCCACIALAMQDLDPMALPTTIDDNPAVVQGAKKYEQIGADAADKWTASLMNTVDFGGSRGAFCIVDTHQTV